MVIFKMCQHRFPGQTRHLMGSSQKSWRAKNDLRKNIPYGKGVTNYHIIAYHCQRPLVYNLNDTNEQCCSVGRDQWARFSRPATKERILQEFSVPSADTSCEETSSCVERGCHTECSEGSVSRNQYGADNMSCNEGAMLIFISETAFFICIGRNLSR